MMDPKSFPERGIARVFPKWGAPGGRERPNDFPVQVAGRHVYANRVPVSASRLGRLRTVKSRVSIGRHSILRTFFDSVLGLPPPRRENSKSVELLPFTSASGCGCSIAWTCARSHRNLRKRRSHESLRERYGAFAFLVSGV